MIRVKSPEMTSAMVFSTGHITKKDAQQLAVWAKDSKPNGLIVFEKGEYGWWVNCDQRRTGRTGDISDEFKDLIRNALNEGCDWLMLDRDGPVYPELKKFDW